MLPQQIRIKKTTPPFAKPDATLEQDLFLHPDRLKQIIEGITSSSDLMNEVHKDLMLLPNHGGCFFKFIFIAIRKYFRIEYLSMAGAFDICGSVTLVVLVFPLLGEDTGREI